MSLCVGRAMVKRRENPVSRFRHGMHGMSRIRHGMTIRVYSYVIPGEHPESHDDTFTMPNRCSYSG